MLNWIYRELVLTTKTPPPHTPEKPVRSKFDATNSIRIISRFIFFILCTETFPSALCLLVDQPLHLLLRLQELRMCQDLEFLPLDANIAHDNPILIILHYLLK